MNKVELRIKRELLGIGQTEIAEGFGVSRRSVARWESMCEVHTAPKDYEEYLQHITSKVNEKALAAVTDDSKVLIYDYSGSDFDSVLSRAVARRAYQLAAERGLDLEIRASADTDIQSAPYVFGKVARIIKDSENGSQITPTLVGQMSTAPLLYLPSIMQAASASDDKEIGYWIDQLDCNAIPERFDLDEQGKFWLGYHAS